MADSLSALELGCVTRARRIADLGAGPGFPGLALAVALPAAAVALVESQSRKTQVIERLASAAGLRVEVLTERAEALAVARPGAFDLVTARAVAPLAVLVEYAAPLLAREGCLVAWKGRRDPDEERAGVAAAAHTGLEQASIEAVRPYPAARNRHLHVFVKVSETPSRFPRRPGMAQKRPLS